MTISQFNFDMRDAAVLFASGIGYVFAFITNIMHPTVLAALIALTGVIVRISFDFYRIRTEKKHDCYWKEQYEKLKEKNRES